MNKILIGPEINSYEIFGCGLTREDYFDKLMEIGKLFDKNFDSNRREYIKAASNGNPNIQFNYYLVILMTALRMDKIEKLYNPISNSPFFNTFIVSIIRFLFCTYIDSVTNFKEYYDFNTYLKLKKKSNPVYLDREKVYDEMLLKYDPIDKNTLGQMMSKIYDEYNNKFSITKKFHNFFYTLADDLKDKLINCYEIWMFSTREQLKFIWEFEGPVNEKILKTSKDRYWNLKLDEKVKIISKFIFKYYRNLFAHSSSITFDIGCLNQNFLLEEKIIVNRKDYYEEIKTLCNIIKQQTNNIICNFKNYSDKFEN